MGLGPVKKGREAATEKKTRFVDDGWHDASRIGEAADAAAHHSRYSTRFVPITRLSQATRLEMARLYLSHYEGTSLSLFLHDLDAKDEVLLVDADGELVGFTTLRVYDSTWLGNPIRVVYSGDTIVHRKHWGQLALAFAWIRRAGQIRRERPDRPLYWLLLVKGHRTFRYLPTFVNSFYPHWSGRTDHMKPLADALALEMFGRDYRPESGLVEFDPSRGQLAADIAQPPAAARTREDVRFFLARNPGFVRGHEMVCLCEFEDWNFKPRARRLFTQDDDGHEHMGAASVH